MSKQNKKIYISRSNVQVKGCYLIAQLTRNKKHLNIGLNYAAAVGQEKELISGANPPLLISANVTAGPSKHLSWRLIFDLAFFELEFGKRSKRFLCKCTVDELVVGEF